jgi:hypothetical protein
MYLKLAKAADDNHYGYFSAMKDNDEHIFTLPVRFADLLKFLIGIKDSDGWNVDEVQESDGTIGYKVTESISDRTGKKSIDEIVSGLLPFAAQDLHIGLHESKTLQQQYDINTIGSESEQKPLL